jgi:hypothetical protein
LLISAKTKLEWRSAQNHQQTRVKIGTKSKHHLSGCWSARWAPLINMPRTFKPRLHHHAEIGSTHTQIGASPSTQAHTKQTHTQIGAETINPSHAEHTQAQISASPSTQAMSCSTQAISFFLAMENRERTENRGRERRREGEQRKKIEERENIGQNERERKKKKKEKKLK